MALMCSQCIFWLCSEDNRVGYKYKYICTCRYFWIEKWLFRARYPKHCFYVTRSIATKCEAHFRITSFYFLLTVFHFIRLKSFNQNYMSTFMASKYDFLTLLKLCCHLTIFRCWKLATVTLRMPTTRIKENYVSLNLTSTLKLFFQFWITATPFLIDHTHKCHSFSMYCTEVLLFSHQLLPHISL